ncbi:peptidylprolyl isomerase [Pseudomonas sp. C27(2019)]|uniref:peptidylprolyl isomerase n=1 Tax=Pseudomonas sp. C27(2019) TaxID=2604941 RepID=UPI0012447FE7|nr:peptidylprolyl isomerase [Pseudomonas sp. C27(2019)]QEY58823.1 peptidylprolyl isomerase [Pseudomonas sp. C27(2019)]
MTHSSTPLFTDAAHAASVTPTDAASPLLIATSNQDLPIVRVNGIEISSTAIAQEMQYHPADSQREVVFLAAQALVLQELLKQRAAEINLEVTAKDAETLEEATTRCLLEQEISTPEIGDTELETFYTRNPRSFTTPPLVSAKHILIAADPEDDLERSTQREVALNIIQQLQDGADFSAMAMTHSSCPSKEQQGSLGQLSKGQTVPEFERQLLRLPLGLAEQPIESRYGYHIVLVEQRVEGELVPFHMVKERIAAQLSQRVWQKSVTQYLQMLVGGATIEGITLQGAASPLVQ